VAKLTAEGGKSSAS